LPQGLSGSLLHSGSLQENPMEFSTKAGSPEKQKTACIVVGMYADKSLGATAAQLDVATGGALRALVKRGDLSGKRGACSMLLDLPGIATQRVLMVGLGAADELNDKAWTEILRALYKSLVASPVQDALLAVADVKVGQRNLDERLRAAVAVLRESAYRFEHTKSKKSDPITLRALSFLVERGDLSAAEHAVAQGVALANGMDLTRDLANMPANICTPSYLAANARSLARTWKIKVEILERKQMEALKMGSLLSVARGSVEPPQVHRIAL